MKLAAGLEAAGLLLVGRGHAAESEARAVVPSNARPESAADQESPLVTGRAELLMASAFVWRGVVYVDEPVTPNLQPRLDLTVREVGPGRLGSCVWLYLPLTTPNHRAFPGLWYTVPTGSSWATTLDYLDYVRFRPVTTYSHMVYLLGTGLLDQAIRPTVGVGADPVENHFCISGRGFKVDWKRGSWALDGKGTLGALKLQSDGWHEHDIDSMLRLRWTRAAPLFGGVVAGLGYETDGRKLHPWGGVTTGFDFAVTG